MGVEIEPLTEDKADRLLGAAMKHIGGYYYPHILYALATEMRIDELKALKWSNSDFDIRLIEV